MSAFGQKRTIDYSPAEGAIAARPWLDPVIVLFGALWPVAVLMLGDSSPGDPCGVELALPDKIT